MVILKDQTMTYPGIMLMMNSTSLRYNSSSKLTFSYSDVEHIISWKPPGQRRPKTQPQSKDNQEIANLINNANKIVFSRTLDTVEETENWRNVKLVHEFDPAAIRRLKEQPGKDIWVGGSNLAVSFIKANLIDEFRFMINPVVIGKSTTIFEGMHDKLNLELKKTRRFHSGNILLYYKPANKES